MVSVFSIKDEAGLANVKRLWGEVIDVRRGEKVWNKPCGEQEGKQAGLPGFIECVVKTCAYLSSSWVAWDRRGLLTSPCLKVSWQRPMPCNRGTLGEEQLHWPKMTVAWVASWAPEVPSLPTLIKGLEEGVIKRTKRVAHEGLVRKEKGTL